MATLVVGAGDFVIVYCDGTGFSTVGGSSAPAGTMAPYAGSSSPAGWLLCYGQTVSRTDYAALFLAIGTTYGAGDGSTTFGLPDITRPGNCRQGQYGRHGSKPSHIARSRINARGQWWLSVAHIKRNRDAGAYPRNQCHLTLIRRRSNPNQTAYRILQPVTTIRNEYRKRRQRGSAQQRAADVYCQLHHQNMISPRIVDKYQRAHDEHLQAAAQIQALRQHSYRCAACWLSRPIPGRGHRLRAMDGRLQRHRLSGYGRG
jgi:hypothetical protein